MTDKTITVTDYPEGTRRERVLALANGAKHALFGGGCSPLPDATLLRAALALDRMRTAHAQIRREQGLTDVDLGPRAGELLASDLVTLGRRQRARDLHDPAGAVEDLLRRRTNTTKSLRAVPKLRLTPAPQTATTRKD